MWFIIMNFSMNGEDFLVSVRLGFLGFVIGVDGVFSKVLCRYIFIC